MTEKDFRVLLEKQRLGKLSNQEKKVLDIFENKMLVKNSDAVFKHNLHKESIKQELKEKINVSKKVILYQRYIAVAASILFIFGATFYFYFLKESNLQKNQELIVQKIMTMKTEFGQKLNITLPDGSKVKLNSGSTIRFPEKFSDSIREITFTGEGFFEIKHNPTQPFVIKTGDLTTRVLGTSFNINTLQDSTSIAVTLATGKVALFTQNEVKKLLPSEQAVFNLKKGNITTKKVQIDDFIEWKEGILRFENVSIGDAMSTLERWYNVKIELKNPELADCKFTGVFSNEALQTILESIVFVKKTVEYEFISKNKVILKGTCN